MKHDSLPVIHMALAGSEAVVKSVADRLPDSSAGFCINIKANGGAELTEKLKKAKTLPDICVLDIALPDKNGYDTLDEVKMQWPLLKTMVFTAIDNEYAVAQMLRRGVNGYLLTGEITEL